nr:hypothetical protein [Angustibacter aerolatus]
MSYEDMRNTLIVELSNRTSQGVPFFQGLDDTEPGRRRRGPGLPAAHRDP